MCDMFFPVYGKLLCMTNHVPGNRKEWKDQYSGIRSDFNCLILNPFVSH